MIKILLFALIAFFADLSAGSFLPVVRFGELDWVIFPIVERRVEGQQTMLAASCWERRLSSPASSTIELIPFYEAGEGFDSVLAAIQAKAAWSSEGVVCLGLIRADHVYSKLKAPLIKLGDAAIDGLEVFLMTYDKDLFLRFFTQVGSPGLGRTVFFSFFVKNDIQPSVNFGSALSVEQPVLPEKVCAISELKRSPEAFSWVKDLQGFDLGFGLPLAVEPTVERQEEKEAPSPADRKTDPKDTLVCKEPPPKRAARESPVPKPSPKPKVKSS